MAIFPKWNQQVFVSTLEIYSYSGIFIASLFAGYLLPFPEEILLVLIGYVSALRYVQVLAASLVALVGILIGDNILYWLGLKGAKLVVRFEKLIRPEKLQEYKDHLARFSGRTIFAARFIPTARVLVPLLAGTLRIPWKRFFLFDFLAGLIGIPSFVLLGYLYENQLAVLISKVEAVRHTVSLLFLLVLGWGITYFIRKNFLRK